MKTMASLAKAFVLSALVGVSFSSQAYMLADNYIGGDDHGYGDVIGKKTLFDTHGLNVSYSGSNVTVEIHTNFAKNEAIGSYASLTKNNLGIGTGDLFLSNSYSPYGSSSNGYLTDNASNGNLWTYGLAIDDPYSKVGGTAKLFKLNGTTNDSNALLSEDFLKAGTYRNGQEVAVDQQSPSVELINTTGTWSVDTTLNLISFSFDTVGTDLLSTGELALHWAMLCGNDVIEGVVSAPVHVNEPTTIALIGLGLIGLGLARRRV